MANFTEEQFKKAYEMANTTTLKFPPDILLHFYAYYKRATEKNGFYSPRDEEDVRSGFKANALLQVESISPEEAKIKYIEMVQKYIGEV
ncbi:acyl-CoA-binding protein [Gillisia sp. M10.2A]|uniref:Acyl-CoA-binding protein n=1 Tax=Gillisia lutea TaxID=2909668 RepID=A0ABS9ELV8_9FLAO|nr:acyl-CoA-binding protein [Gillisia lutea]MCF4102436.1 acyl-CoA-binding protein [Gillisia lutea]